MTFSPIVKKPWGEYQDFYRSNGCTMKKLTIKDGQAISYQKHDKRGEFWFVEQGRPILKHSVMSKPLESYSKAVLEKGDTVEIPIGTWHQLIAPKGGGDVIIFEMQYGFCSEDDIERVDDRYNRH